MAAQTGNAAPVLSDFQGQGAVYDGLMRTLHDGTFVHAYLITGLEGMGKRTLARLLAQYWLCQAPEGEKRSSTASSAGWWSPSPPCWAPCWC